MILSYCWTLEDLNVPKRDPSASSLQILIQNRIRCLWWLLFTFFGSILFVVTMTHQESTPRPKHKRGFVLPRKRLLLDKIHTVIHQLRVSTPTATIRAVKCSPMLCEYLDSTQICSQLRLHIYHGKIPWFTSITQIILPSVVVETQSLPRELPRLDR